MRDAGPQDRDTPSTVLLVMLEAGRYYHVKIIPRPEEQRWDLEAVDSMIPRDRPMPAGPSTLSPDQPDSLTSIASGQAGTWHSGHALDCLWRWTQRRSWDTRP